MKMQRVSDLAAPDGCLIPAILICPVASRAVPAADSGASRAEEGFWVAVLPFKFGGANAELTALAEGLSEDIVTGSSPEKQPTHTQEGSRKAPFLFYRPARPRGAVGLSQPPPSPITEMYALREYKHSRRCPMLHASLWALLLLAVFALLNSAWVMLFVRLHVPRDPVPHGKVIPIDVHRLRGSRAR